MTTLFVGISLVFGLIFFLRYFSLRKQLQYLIELLSKQENGHPLRKVTTSGSDKRVSELSQQINQLIGTIKETEIRQVRVRNNYQKLLADSSHDLRTPLTVIRGRLQYILRNETLNPSVHEEVIKTIEQTQRLREFIDDLFEMSLIEMDDFPIELERVDLRELIAESLAESYELLSSKGTEPIISLGEFPLWLDMDRKIFNRIFDNLLANALRYKENQLEIKVLASDAVIIFQMKNDGMKLSNDEFLKMFERYQSLDMADRRRRGGLGLAIVSELVDKTKGRIEPSVYEDMAEIKITWEMSKM